MTWNNYLLAFGFVLVMMTIESQTLRAGEGTIDQIREFSAVAVRITALPSGRIGTGTILDYDEPADLLLLVTNHHILKSARSLQISIQLVDSTNRVVDTSHLSVSLYSINGDSLFAISATGADIAAVVTPNLPPKGIGLRHFIMRPSALCSIDQVYQGESVLYFGFPLGKAVNNYCSILRTGTVAGIDTMSGQIILDAQAFGGSSGSPVFVDPRFVLRKSATCIGIIAGYLPFEKKLVSQETGRVEMIQNENSGLAIVMPVTEIDLICREAIRRYLAKPLQSKPK